MARNGVETAKEQMKGLVSPLARGNEYMAKIFRINKLWCSIGIQLYARSDRAQRMLTSFPHNRGGSGRDLLFTASSQGDVRGSGLCSTQPGGP